MPRAAKALKKGCILKRKESYFYKNQKPEIKRPKPKRN